MELTDKEIMDAMPKQFHEDLANVCRLAAYGPQVEQPGLYRVILNTGAVAFARAAIAAHEAALAAERPAPVPGWQPIDTAPHDGTEILASDYDAIEVANWSWDAWETGSGWIDRNGQRLFPAWWQPLPDHPPIPQPPQANTTHPTPTEPPTND